MKANANTPAHNALVMFFHRDEFRERIVRSAFQLGPNTEVRTEYTLEKKKRRWLDVAMKAEILRGNTISHIDVNIEIKTVVDDDFPCVLRQMKETDANLLLLERYTGRTSMEDFVKTFEHEGIKVLFMRNIKWRDYDDENHQLYLDNLDKEVEKEIAEEALHATKERQFQENDLE